MNSESMETAALEAYKYSAIDSQFLDLLIYFKSFKLIVVSHQISTVHLQLIKISTTASVQATTDSWCLLHYGEGVIEVTH